MTNLILKGKIFSSLFEKFSKKNHLFFPAKQQKKTFFPLQRGGEMIFQENINSGCCGWELSPFPFVNWLCILLPGVLPCLPYSQQTKMKRRGNISLKLIAEMCVNAGFSHIITVDLHSKVSYFHNNCLFSGGWVAWKCIRF